MQGCCGWDRLACKENVTAAATTTNITLLHFFCPPTTFGNARRSTDVGLRLSLTSLEGATASTPMARSPTSASAASASSADRNNGSVLVTCPAASQKIALVLARSGEREEAGGKDRE